MAEGESSPVARQRISVTAAPRMPNAIVYQEPSAEAGGIGQAQGKVDPVARRPDY